MAWGRNNVILVRGRGTEDFWLHRCKRKGDSSKIRCDLRV